MKSTMKPAAVDIAPVRRPDNPPILPWQDGANQGRKTDPFVNLCELHHKSVLAWYEWLICSDEKAPVNEKQEKALPSIRAFLSELYGTSLQDRNTQRVRRATILGMDENRARSIMGESKIALVFYTEFAISSLLFLNGAITNEYFTLQIASIKGALRQYTTEIEPIAGDHKDDEHPVYQTPCGKRLEFALRLVEKIPQNREEQVKRIYGYLTGFIPEDDLQLYKR